MDLIELSLNPYWSDKDIQNCWDTCLFIYLSLNNGLFEEKANHGGTQILVQDRRYRTRIFADGLNRGLSYICYTGYRILGVLMRYLGSRINGVGSGIGRVGSGIIASGSEITSHWDRDQQFFEGSAIRLRHFGGIRDQNWSCFWNQGSEIWVQKWGQQWKNIPRYNPGILVRCQPLGSQNDNLCFKILLFLSFAINFFSFCRPTLLLGHRNRRDPGSEVAPASTVRSRPACQQIRSTCIFTKWKFRYIISRLLWHSKKCKGCKWAIQFYWISVLKWSIDRSIEVTN